jgi:hypothetical protein
MTWVRRLKQMFNTEASICPQCDGEAKVIACFENQIVIDKILNYLQAKEVLPQPRVLLPAARVSQSPE